MRKIICILVSLMIMGTASFAQQKPADKAAKKPKSAATNTTTKSSDAKVSAVKTAPTKKDGTPDMRYKANKDAAKPAPKLKKDGTPDMRYKANKDAAKKK